MYNFELIVGAVVTKYYIINIHVILHNIISYYSYFIVLANHRYYSLTKVHNIDEHTALRLHCDCGLLTLCFSPSNVYAADRPTISLISEQTWLAYLPLECFVVSAFGVTPSRTSNVSCVIGLYIIHTHAHSLQ